MEEREVLEKALREAMNVVMQYRSADDSAAIKVLAKIVEQQLQCFERGIPASSTFTVDFATHDGWVSFTQRDRRFKTIVWTPQHKNPEVRAMAQELRERLAQQTGSQAENRWREPDYAWLGEQKPSR